VEVNDRRREFERIAMPHLDAAYNLARWLMRHDQDAEDAVQDAMLRAFRFFRGADTGRAWLLQIVRNTCYTLMARKGNVMPSTTPSEMFDQMAAVQPSPDAPLELLEDRELLDRALNGLPVEFREAIVLRELQGLSYKEISQVAQIPVGTVMSRLARAREQLHEFCRAKESKERGV
jgi:RNA polymerase sigma-70 factor (ECF subfamily)